MEDKSDRASYWSTAVTQPRRVLCAYLINWPIDLAVRRLGRASAAQARNSRSQCDRVELNHGVTETRRTHGGDGRRHESLTPSPGTPGESGGEGAFRTE